MILFALCMLMLGMYLQEEIFPKLPSAISKYSGFVISAIIVLLLYILKIPVLSQYPSFSLVLIAFGVFIFLTDKQKTVISQLQSKKICCFNMRLYDDKLSYPLIVRHQRDLYLFGVFYMIVNALQDEPKVFVFQIDCLRKSILHDQDLVNDVYTKYICCDYL